MTNSFITAKDSRPVLRAVSVTPVDPRTEAVGRKLLLAHYGILLTLVALCASLLWAYWPTLAALPDRWQHDPQYSHGYVVPLFALVVLWFRKDHLQFHTLRPSWWGLTLVTAGLALRLGGAWIYLHWFDGLSLLPVLLGCCVLAGGWQLGLWAMPAIGLLVFMVPLPFQIEVALATPLRRLATYVSTYALQTLGLPAVAEGNVILIDNVQIGVHEACSGLGMLFAFFALSATVAVIIQRPLCDRIVIFLSAIPIGVLMNLIRITAAGFAYRSLSSEAARIFFHDLAGWLMMPLALCVLWVELKFLGQLFISRQPDCPVPVAQPPQDLTPVDPVAVPVTSHSHTL